MQAADVASGNPIENVASAKAFGLGGVALSPEDSTETPVTKKDAGAPLANTGSSLANTGGVAFIAARVAGVLLLGGLALTMVSRRLREHTSGDWIMSPPDSPSRRFRVSAPRHEPRSHETKCLQDSKDAD